MAVRDNLTSEVTGEASKILKLYLEHTIYVLQVCCAS